MKSSYLTSAIKQFRYYESLGNKTILQLSEEELQHEPSPGINSIAVMVKHLHGNMLSRWTDFLNSDGEKTWRKRDEEFQQAAANKADLLQQWNEGWSCLFSAIEALTESDLERIIYIRNEGHTVTDAINRQLCHYAYHVGQIVYLGKIIRGEEWQSLSIPKGQSGNYNKEKFDQEKSTRHFTDEWIDKNKK